MQSVYYKVWFNKSPATQQQLDLIETVTVTQAMDRIWEATFEIIILTSDKGQWTGDGDSYTQPFQRVRLEIRVGSTGAYQPLIDGPVTSVDSTLESDPGKSLLTMRVSDDGYALLKEDKNEQYTQSSDGDIAQAIFSDANITNTSISSSPQPYPGDRQAAVMSRFTLMETLQALALRNGLHAWVQAADDVSGDPTGIFDHEDQNTSGLTPLVLLGKGRNLDSISINNNAARPSNVTGARMDSSQDSPSITNATSQYSEELSGNDQSAADSSGIGTAILPPGASLFMDVQAACDADAYRRSFAYEAHGTVRNLLYDDVLQPYKLVEVQALDRLSGNYLIQSVTHRLTRSEYTQEFTLVRKGQSSGSSANSAGASKVF